VGVLVAAGGTGVFGVVMVMQPDMGITASDRTMMRVINRVFKFKLFIYLYYSIVKNY
jgi:hypothetical protein